MSGLCLVAIERDATIVLFLQHLHPGLFSNPHAVAERRNCIKRWMFGHTGLFFMGCAPIAAPVETVCIRDHCVN